jgi:hypothetical protein
MGGGNSMSKITLSGNASGTGTFTLASPNSNSDRTLDLPDAGGTMVLDTATQTLTNKTLTTPNIDSAQFATVTGTAPLYSARAWVNFTGTGTVAITAAGNVSSITDGGTGTYTVNFTTAMQDANYAVPTSSQPGTFNGTGVRTTTSVGFNTYNSSVSPFDSSVCMVAIFR